MTNNETRINDYKDLIVWQRGISLVKRVYQATQSFPGDERYGLAFQMRRAAVSIPSNIAEGQARHTTREFIQFISHAEGSVAELDTQTIVAIELGYCTSADVQDISGLILEIRRMLNALRRRLGQKL